jgi:hypothetical protein
MIVRKTSVFPAKRDVIFEKLQRLETLQAVAAPYASFTPVTENAEPVWRVGGVSSYRFKLFGIVPFGTHTIRIERFDMDVIQSRERNEYVPVWDHKITLRDKGEETEYTDEVKIQAGWKTAFIWLWAEAFYAHRQRKWVKMLKENQI